MRARENHSLNSGVQPIAMAGYAKTVWYFACVRFKPETASVQ
jgi:hypothetical protein